MSLVEEKASYVLNIILVIFLLIGIRVWYLAVIKHEEHVQIARRPQIKTVIEYPSRGTIRDRFNIPLAVNKIQYNVSILYDPIQRLPRVKWTTDTNGKRKKIFYRKEYITKLAKFLANELSLDATYIEDLLYSKAAIFPNSPYILKENITEKDYYRLHFLEKDWPGLSLQISAKRHYPQKMVGSTIIGYLGAIDEKEHSAIQNELKELQQFLHNSGIGIPEILPKGYPSAKEVKRRYLELKEKSYTINSRVGKSGIEGKFDDQLRGLAGKSKYEVDIKGNILRKLPESYPATPGRRFLLTISSELQEFAEKLLIESEVLRHKRFASAGKNHHLIQSPWIKGGSIVAMIPSTGEIVAMASYPRFDPNDFCDPTKSVSVARWLETPSYIGQIWDGLRPLEREFGEMKPLEAFPSEKYLSWELFLDTVLSLRQSVRKAIDRVGNLQQAIYIQNAMETLFKLSEETKMQTLIDALFPPEKGHLLTFFQTEPKDRLRIIETIRKKTTLLDEIILEISPYLTHIERNDDKILLLDLLRLVCPSHLFEDRVLTQTGEESLSAYRSFNQSVIVVQKEVRKIVESVFHEKDFKEWREKFFTIYLKERRKEEKEKKLYEKAYIDYLKEVETSLFETFFERNRWHFVAYYLLDNAPIDPYDPLLPYYEKLIQKSLAEKPKEAYKLKEHLMQMDFDLALSYLKTMRSFNELTRPLWGKYYFPFGAGKNPKEQALARHFYPTPGFGYARSHAFQEVAPLGSTFKLIVGYEALKAHYEKASTLKTFDINPLTIIDQSPPYSQKINQATVLGYTVSGIPITRQYKGGRLPRAHPNIGRVDLKGALERSSNIYFSLLAGDIIPDPSHLIDTCEALSFGRKTGVDLPGEVKGSIPYDICDNKTALYSFAIGQHALTVTPIETGVMLSAFANGGEVLKPQIVKTIASIEPSSKQSLLFSSTDFAFQDYLAKVGIFFPLFTEGQEKTKEVYMKQTEKEVMHTIFLPEEIRSYLLDALYLVTNGARGTGRINSIRTLVDRPYMRTGYNEIKPYFAGKTSTAEISYRPTLDRECGPIICKHIWFGGISFEEKYSFETPELVVIIELRFADHGKEAAPLATEIIKKWREIKAIHGTASKTP